MQEEIFSTSRKLFELIRLHMHECNNENCCIKKIVGLLPFGEREQPPKTHLDEDFIVDR